MAKFIKVWFDPEADFLEVRFLEELGSDELGYMRETDNDDLMERVDLSGEVIGFSIFQVSTMTKDKPLYAQLAVISG
jgi:uncharacterized protein YuzE